MPGPSQFKVSVCVSTYNQENVIGRCLDSIVSQQTDFPFEIIVSDDCSTDNTPAILRSYAEIHPSLIRIKLQEKNIGATQNLQDVHRMASGEYVAHCDGDDAFLPGKLQKQSDFLDKNPDVVQCWHKMYLIDGDDKILEKLPKRFTTFLEKKLTIKNLALAYFSIGYHSSQMYRRAAKTVYDRDNFTIDYFYALDIGRNGKSAHINDFLGCYRTIPNASLTTNSSSMQKVDDAAAEAALYFSKEYPELRKIFSGNLWFRRFLIRYAGNSVSEKYNSILNQLGSGPLTMYYGIRSGLLYLSLYSNLKFLKLRSRLFGRR